MELTFLALSSWNCTCFNFEQLYRKLLETWASSWIHSIWIHLSTNINFQLWLFSPLLWSCHLCMSETLSFVILLFMGCWLFISCYLLSKVLLKINHCLSLGSFILSSPRRSFIKLCKIAIIFLDEIRIRRRACCLHLLSASL